MLNEECHWDLGFGRGARGTGTEMIMIMLMMDCSSNSWNNLPFPFSAGEAPPALEVLHPSHGRDHLRPRLCGRGAVRRGQS
jgi:hypothetical protein